MLLAISLRHLILSISFGGYLPLKSSSSSLALLSLFFSSIENGIYVTVSVSAALFAFRAFKANGRFLGKAKIHSVVGDHLLDPTEDKEDKKGRCSAKESHRRRGLGS